MDTSMPAMVSVGVPAVAFGILLMSLNGLVQREYLSIGILVSALILGPLYLLNEGNLIIPELVQPRYFLPLLPMILGMALSFSSGRLHLSLPQRSIMIAVVGIAQSFALHAQIRRYIVGTEVVGWNLDGTVEWWWGHGFPSPNTVWLLASAFFLIVLIVSLCFQTSIDHPDLNEAVR
jgi:hypothetical protein